MARATVPKGAVVVQCVCGEDVEFDAQKLGRIIRCPHCQRYIRPALQFLLIDQALAPNLTVQCNCGRFVVTEARRAGKTVRCPGCRSHLKLPAPAIKFGAERVVRVPRKVLERQLRQVLKKPLPRPLLRPGMRGAAHLGRITLHPGEHICINEDCGALLRAGANVCPRCGTNRLTGEAYKGAGPEADPVGKWKQL